MINHPISKVAFFAFAVIAWQESIGAVNLQVQVNPGTVAPGDAVLIELIVSNDGAGLETNIVVDLEYPADMNDRSNLAISGGAACAGTISNNNACDSGEVVEWTVGTLTPGQSVTLSLPPVVTAGLTDGTLIAWNATVSDGVGQVGADSAVLEIDTNRYTSRFGGSQVEKSDVLHIAEMGPGITMVGDLALPDSFPEDVFDCIVLTQTVNLVFDARAALLSTRKMLKPGGVALITVPGISPMFGDADGRWGHCWSFTTHSFSRLLEDVFAEDTVTVSSCGNVLSTTAFLHGLASEDLKVSELEHRDPAFEMLVLATVVKRGGAG